MPRLAGMGTDSEAAAGARETETVSVLEDEDMKGGTVVAGKQCARTTGALRQYAAACSASLLVMTTGAWLGWPSPALKKLLANETELVVSHPQLSWVVSLMDAGSAVSPVPAGILMDAVGRRSVLLVTGALYVITWGMALLASTPSLLYLARFLAGMGKGVAFTVVPVYLGEIASTPIRGALSTMFAGLLWAGTMFEYSIGPAVSYNTLLLLSLTMPVAFLATFLLMPESPYYLVMRRRHEDARKSLNWLRNGSSAAIGDDVDNDPVEQELKEMKKGVTQDMQNKGSFSDLLSSPSNRKATFIVVIISMFQRTCGISPLLAYSSTTLPETGSAFGPDQIVLVFGFILTFSNFLATPLVDRLGRKPLLIFSGAVCGISTTVSGIFYYYYLHNKSSLDSTGFIWVPYVSLCFFGLAHSVGIGVIPHTLLAELYPQNMKRYAAATASITFAIASFGLNKIYSTVQMTVGVHVMFGFFAVNGLVCALFSYFVIFETKGKTFAEIQRILRNEK